MPLIFKRLALILSIAGAFAGNNAAADKEPPPFHPPGAAELPHHQTNDKVTIGVDPYISGDKMAPAFGKLIPYQYGILPVLISIKNESGQTIRIKDLKAEYVGPNGDRIEATPAKEVRYARPVKRPNVPVTPVPIPKRKNPLEAWEIEGRALAAEVIPAGNTAFGFIYFQTGLERGAKVYLSGITSVPSGKELMFFEIPLEQ